MYQIDIDTRTFMPTQEKKVQKLRKVKCVVWSKEFPMKKNLLRHEAIHERINHICEKCGASYN